jgi:DNA-binding MarR family transcriptional regulator
LIERILALLRATDADMDRIEEAAAARLGVHRTDFRCLDILSRGTALTAGALAAAAGLSTGAVTALLDRLERAGYVRRGRDPEDRRRVVIEVTSAATEEVWPVFARLVASSNAMLRDFSREELETILRFSERQAELIKQHAQTITRR